MDTKVSTSDFEKIIVIGWQWIGIERDGFKHKFVTNLPIEDKTFDKYDDAIEYFVVILDNILEEYLNEDEVLLS